MRASAGSTPPKALKMPGVFGILTADDVPQFPPPQTPILTNEPLYVGEPILAVAAVDEPTAADALEKIKIDFEQLPHRGRSARQPAIRADRTRGQRQCRRRRRSICRP